MNPKNPKIYRQADSRWGSLPYPTKAYSFAHNGCGCCAVTHTVIEQDKYKDLTPADVRKFMVQYATKGHGTLWKGIKEGLEHYGYNVHWNQADSMADIWKVLDGKSLKRGVILFGSTKGPDGTVWTSGGHYINFCDYEVKDGKHYFWLKDSGGRKHDKTWCYEKSMRGDVRQVWICTSLKEEPKTTPKTEPKDVTYETYGGAMPSKVIKKGSKGSDVEKWQKFLKWMGYSLSVDKVFGKDTLAKTKACQKKLGFTGKDVDGIVGKNTIAKAKAYKKSVKKNSNTAVKTGKYVDVSYWQHTIDWAKAKSEIDGAFLRCSYTAQSSFSLSDDSTYKTNLKNATANGVAVGAYHYSQAISVAEAKKEAEYICKRLDKSKITLPVVCDWEFGGRLSASKAKSLGKAKCTEIVSAFCDVVKANGYTPMVYANYNTFKNYLDYDKLKKKYLIWLAQYASKASLDYNYWQYTSSGSVKGISGRVDMNVRK